VRIVTGGGGGFGDPKDRNPQSVEADIKNGYITAEAARKDYSV